MSVCNNIEGFNKIVKRFKYRIIYNNYLNLKLGKIY